jgi:hypothetical protein
MESSEADNRNGCNTITVVFSAHIISNTASKSAIKKAFPGIKFYADETDFVEA